MLQEYNLTIKHVRGKENVIADDYLTTSIGKDVLHTIHSLFVLYRPAPIPILRVSVSVSIQPIFVYSTNKYH